MAKQNVIIVENFLKQFSQLDTAGVLALLNDAVIWKVMGREGGLPLSCEMKKTDVVDLMKTIESTFPEGMSLTPSGFTASDGRVAVEAESYGKKSDGTLYNNKYHFLFEIENEQIISIREYMDTLHVKSVFLDN